MLRSFQLNEKSDMAKHSMGECQTRVLRRSAWHWRAPHASPAAPARAPGVFETELAQAQRVERERREKIPDLKPAPR
jgi:hypothetical protein